tara:strand:- start:248 stop:454 length:207 start_codon:yes stop_codon:yes gene_type:complete
MSSIKLKKGYSDEFLLSNAPDKDSQKSLTVNKTMVSKPTVNHFDKTHLSAGQIERLRRYKERMGQVNL